MDKSKTLYKKSSTGKLLQWNIIREGNTYWAEYGQVDGKIQSDTPTTCEGKNIGKSNETTPEQQAQAEADAKYTKQIDIKGYVENPEDANTFVFKPTLAHKYTDHGNKMPDLMLSSRKLDGVRCYITKDGAYSRNGKQWVSTKFIEANLVKFFEKFPNFVLDGELYAHKYKDNFNEIVKLIKRTKHFKEGDWDRIERELEYHVFDYFDPEDPDLCAIHRINNLFNWFNAIPDYAHDNIITVRNDFTHKCDVPDMYAKYMEEGYEGIMLRDPAAVYEFKRSYKLQKYKEFQDDEYEIVDIEEGAGNRSGMFGRMICKTNEGITFEANARGNEEYYRELLNNKNNYIGKKATIRYQNLTPDGKPRFGVCVAIRNYE